MANKKDLIDAQAFSRRRLLTAFTSGAPGGKELEPASPLKAVIASVALSLLLVVGGLFYGLINKGLPDGWENNSVIVVKDTGERYVAVEGVLHPVINTASARLAIPAGEYRVLTASSRALEGITVGPAIGIVGAPDDLPLPEDLVAQGWTACPLELGTGVSLSSDAVAAAATDAVLVASGGEEFIVVDGKRHPLGEQRDQVVRQLGLAGAVPLEVESRWLNLFDLGSPLEPLVIEGAGDPMTDDLFVGTVVRPTGSSSRFVIMADGTLAPLSDFAYQLYLLGTGAMLGSEREVIPSEIPFDNSEAAGAADWPTAVITPLPVGTQPCALLGRQDFDASPFTSLAVATTPVTSPGAVVAPGQGALVLAASGGGSDAGIVTLIDQSGTAFPLPGADADVLARLGYAPEDVTTVPLAWIQFFAAGPDLTIAAAASSPSGGTVVTGSEGADDTPAATPEANPSATLPPAPSAEPPAEASGGTMPPASAPATASAGSSTSTDDSSFAMATGGQGGACEPGTFEYSTSAPAALTTLQAQALKERGHTGEGVTVAIVDSGIDVSNPHLGPDVVIGGVNLVGDGERPDGMVDLDGHGTAIAGLIAAQQIQESAVVGLAPDATLLSVRVFKGKDQTSVEAGYGPSIEKVAQGITWAVDHGADIINVSLSDPNPNTALEAAIAYAAANDVLVVASGGNRLSADDKADSPRYPGAYPGVLAVAAADPQGHVTDSSIHGDHIDVAAPGQAVITSATGAGDCVYAPDHAAPSYATGYVAAAAALVAGAFPDETPQAWAYRLAASAVRTNPDERDAQSGWGLIQPLDAIQMSVGPDLRGPYNAILDVAPAPITPPSVKLDIDKRPQPRAELLARMGAIGLAVVFVIAGLSMIAKVRRPAPAQNAPVVKEGLLDRQRSAATTAHF